MDDLCNMFSKTVVNTDEEEYRILCEHINIINNVISNNPSKVDIIKLIKNEYSLISRYNHTFINTIMTNSPGFHHREEIKLAGENCILMYTHFMNNINVVIIEDCKKVIISFYNLLVLIKTSVDEYYNKLHNIENIDDIATKMNNIEIEDDCDSCDLACNLDEYEEDDYNDDEFSGYKGCV
jgi:hypothetical protein